MARVTVEDCLQHANSKFELATIAAKRARQLARGANAELPWEDDKPTVMALREIAAGRITIAILDEPDLPPIAASMEPPQPEPTEEELEADEESEGDLKLKSDDEDDAEASGDAAPEPDATRQPNTDE